MVFKGCNEHGGSKGCLNGLSNLEVVIGLCIPLGIGRIMSNGLCIFIRSVHFSDFIFNERSDTQVCQKSYDTLRCSTREWATIFHI